MKIKNLTNVLETLKPKLREYLEAQGTKFTRNHFTCPNRRLHKNNDDRPACGFYPNESAFNCFGCSSSGDILNAYAFLEGASIEGADFIDAVNELCTRFSIPVEVEEDSFDKEKKHLKKMMVLIKDVCHKTYKDTPLAQEYVKKRNWESVADKSEFGYCNYGKLKTFLYSKGYSDNDLENAGLSDQLMNERLLIPIFDEYNKIVSFCSRRIKEEDSQRYINSSTCTIYKKQNTLYNLNIAKNFDTIILVEGHANVLTFRKYGMDNVVALGGTAISDEHIRQLVKYHVKKVILCLDNDQAGHEALKNIIIALTPISELSLGIIELQKAKDVDEFINQFGIDEFKNLKVKSIFEFKLDKYIESKGDKNLKQDLLEYIASEKSFIEKEQMCKKLAKAANVRQETAFSEVELVEKKKMGDTQVTTSDIVRETGALLKEVMLFDSWAWSRGKLLGLNIAQYPIFTEKFDGLQNKFYIVSAEENTGKSAFTGSLMLNLALSNPTKVFILYFGLDVDSKTLVARMGASLSGMPINTFSNPKHRIMENEACNNRDELIKKREDAIEIIRGLSDSITVKDERTIHSILDMEKTISLYQKKFPEKQIVVFIDSLNQINIPGKKETRELYMEISKTLKAWTVKFDIPVIAISELRKLAHPGIRPTSADLKEAGDFAYDSDAIILLYNELHSKRESERTFIGPNNIIYPIIELLIWKNKTSAFKGVLYYKFIADMAQFEECSISETRAYWNQ